MFGKIAAVALFQLSGRLPCPVEAATEVEEKTNVEAEGDLAFRAPISKKSNRSATAVPVVS